MSGLVEYLINAGASVNARDDHGQPGLQKAVFSRKAPLRVVQLLVDAGADRIDEAAAGAVGFGHQEVVEWLLPRGARLLDPGLILEVAKQGWVEVLRMMVSSGSDPNYRNRAGSSALMWARSLAVVEFLLLAGADPHLKANDGESALSLACERRNIEIAAALLGAGADPNARTFSFGFGKRRGPTVLRSLLERGGDPELVKLLVASGADPDADQLPKTPLDLGER